MVEKSCSIDKVHIFCKTLGSRRDMGRGGGGGNLTNLHRDFVLCAININTGLS